MNSRRRVGVPSASSSKAQTRCTSGCESERYITRPSGLKPRPLGTMSSLASGPRRPAAAPPSSRYKAPAGDACDMSRTIVPAQKRPWRSQRPSLKRMPSWPCCTAASMGPEASPPSPRRTWKMPVSIAATKPPSRCSAMQPTRSAQVQLCTRRPAQSKRRIERPSMSTQYKACSATDHSGLSPTVSRSSQSTSMLEVTRRDRCARTPHPGR